MIPPPLGEGFVVFLSEARGRDRRWDRGRTWDNQELRRDEGEGGEWVKGRKGEDG